jgi:HEAT repeat protein
MNSERALPLLRKIIQDREASQAELRAQALYLITRHAEDDETEDILLDVLRNDPDLKIRQQVVIWLSRIPTERALDALEEIILSSDDTEMKEQAAYAISEHDGERATTLLLQLAGDSQAESDIRRMVIHRLAQRGGVEHINFLKELYRKVDDNEVKESIIYGIALYGDDEDDPWLLNLAFSEDENDEIRAFALQWACKESHCPPAELMKYYRQEADRQLREMIIYLLSQDGGSEALDGLISIARTETDHELRRSVVFWIGQFEDPRAEEFLLEIINE